MRGCGKWDWLAPICHLAKAGDAPIYVPSVIEEIFVRRAGK